MTYSFTAKKRIRKDFGKLKLPTGMEVPFLLAIQRDSYRQVTQTDVAPAEREAPGLPRAVRSVFPIVRPSGPAALEYVRSRLRNPRSSC